MLELCRKRSPWLEPVDDESHQFILTQFLTLHWKTTSVKLAQKVHKEFVKVRPGKQALAKSLCRFGGVRDEMREG
jgi:hypothetical protein